MYFLHVPLRCVRANSDSHDSALLSLFLRPPLPLL